jgi:hypothetical protein
MKQQRSWSESSRDDLQDLDALVLAEIESLRGRGQGKGAPQPDGSRPRSSSGSPAAAPRGDTGAPPVAPIRRRVGQEPNSTGEEFDGLSSDALLDEPAGSDTEDVPLAASLLSPEEDAFVARAVGFLSQREHADMILGQIWEQLTEADPGGFYQAPASARPAQATADDTAGAEPSPAQSGREGDRP